MNFKTGILGIILLMNVWKVSSFQNNYTDGENMKCGQTPCKSPGECCHKDKNCCCVSKPTGWSVNCVSGHSWSIRWWGSVLIVAAVIAALFAFLCYRRRKRQTRWDDMHRPLDDHTSGSTDAAYVGMEDEDTGYVKGQLQPTRIYLEAGHARA